MRYETSLIFIYSDILFKNYCYSHICRYFCLTRVRTLQEWDWFIVLIRESAVQSISHCVMKHMQYIFTLIYCVAQLLQSYLSLFLALRERDCFIVLRESRAQLTSKQECFKTHCYKHFFRIIALLLNNAWKRRFNAI